MRDRYPILPQEHFEMVEYSMRGPVQGEGAPTLFSLSERKQRDLSGNGTHAFLA